MADLFAIRKKVEDHKKKAVLVKEVYEKILEAHSKGLRSCPLSMSEEWLVNHLREFGFKAHIVQVKDQSLVLVVQW